MFYWKRIALGYYEARRDGVGVARVTRIKDTGEPIWQMDVLDGTELRKTSSGRVCDTFCTLGDAKFAYGYAYRLEQEAVA